MSRRRKKPKEIEVTHLIEHPPQRRASRDTNRLLDLLDRIATQKPHKEGRH